MIVDLGFATTAPWDGMPGARRPTDLAATVLLAPAPPSPLWRRALRALGGLALKYMGAPR